MPTPNQDRDTVRTLIDYMSSHVAFRVHGWNLIRLIAERRLREIEQEEVGL